MPDSTLYLPALLTLIPALWWIVSWVSVHFFLTSKSSLISVESAEPCEALSLFKPLPPFKNHQERQRFARSLESFARQLLPGDEMLILGEKNDETFWQQQANEWIKFRPGLSIRFFVPPPDNQPHHHNPKIQAMALLAPQATYSLWWWSDADILIPEGELMRIRAEFAHSSAILQTQAYMVPSVRRKEDWLDAMFIHLELLPGLTLLSRKKNVGFACGGSLLFRKTDFEKRVAWNELGAELADDYFLGQKMHPVRLGRTLMETESGEEGLISSWLHYLRWEKTLRWCQPTGFAGLFFLQPTWLSLTGWLLGMPGYSAFLLWVWLMVLEASWASMLFRHLNIQTTLAVFWVSPLWSAVRSATWLLCWFPIAIHWSGIKWWKSKAVSVSSPKIISHE
jgi:hypothetical protein